MIPLRRSDKQWTHLGVLLTRLERILETCARLDAYRGTFGGECAIQRDVVDKQIQRLERRIGAELDRATAERLIQETRRKMQTTRAAA